ncbi:MAG: 3-deoxy-7-phosphoheptulonate synthase [Victivallales bacterium]|nr:3-deoxy-7-phosphoheptulonate synthase [Victivallales bacterium]
MENKIDNVNIEKIKPLPSPDHIKEKYPLPENTAKNIFLTRKLIQDVLDKKTDKVMVIVGPCSIHNPAEALEYAQKLTKLTESVKDKLIPVMRVYFEKPRTTIGWKGLIYDPDLDGSCNIHKGLEQARKLLIDIAEMGLPIATEILDPVTAQYITDTISWAAVGARTTESQPHRQLISGLSMPVGFKNTTDGNIQTAIDAVKSAQHRHTFIGLLSDGRNGSFYTKGNKYSHVVLRGGSNTPNYTPEYIAFTKELMKNNNINQNIIIDCSHANSGKKAALQSKVLANIIEQFKKGEKSIVGVMIESNLKHGKQSIDKPQSLLSGISVTDECIGWVETESMIKDLYNSITP